METKHIIINSRSTLKPWCWAHRLLFVYSVFDGKRLHFPFDDQLRIVDTDGDVTIEIDCTLKETHPHVVDHILFVAKIYGCSIVE